jgi:predicted peptidase
MVTRKRLITSVVLGLAFCTTITAALGAGAPNAESGQQRPQKLQRTIKVNLDYLMYLPKDYAQKDSWPLLLFLHGSGERGDNLDLVKKHGPPKLIAAGKEFPFIVVSPQCPKYCQDWQPCELLALLDEITEKYKVDKDRVFVTGLSMGGYGTWSLAAYSPDRFAAIVPICGEGDPGWAQRISPIPVWVFHGGKDTVVPIKGDKELVAALKKAGGDVKFTVYPEAKHDSWTQAYNDPDLYKWMLAQQRTPKAPGGTSR